MVGFERARFRDEFLERLDRGGSRSVQHDAVQPRGVGDLRGVADLNVLDKAAFGSVAELVPQFLGDKGDEGVQQQQRLAQDHILDRETGGLGVGRLEFRLRDFHIPVTKIVPEKSVERLHRRTEFEFNETPFHLARRREQALKNGVVVRVKFLRREARQNRRERSVVSRLAAHLAEPARIPQLVTKILTTLDPVFLKTDVLPLRRDRHDAEAQAIGTVGSDEIERVGRVAEGLRHLAALLVANDAGEVNMLERNAPLQRFTRPHKFQSGHNHTRDPEKDNVRPRHERRRRVKIIEALRLHLVLVGPAHRREGPKP